MTKDIEIRRSNTQESLIKRLWNFLFKRKKKEEPIDLKESLYNNIESLNTKIEEAESAFSVFLGNVRSSEKSKNDLVDKKKEWEQEAQNLFVMLEKTKQENNDPEKTSRLNDALRHVIAQQIRVEKRIEAQEKVVKNQNETKNNMVRSISMLKANRDDLSSKIEELVARESLAKTQRDMYSKTPDTYHSDELEDFENSVRKQEAIAIGLKELRTTSYTEITESEFDIELELEERMADQK